jgi:hypothetical protein
MSWIKRNLFFFIGGLVAVGFMGFGGFLLFNQISEENQLGEEIRQQYAKLNELNNQKPHPGNGPVDNIKTALEQKAALRDYITTKARGYFQRIAPIPDNGGARVSNAEFATQLRPAIVQLNRFAEQQGVTMPKKDYYFSFESERSSMTFDTNGIDKMAVQLGEIKAIAEIILGARVSALDGIRREPVVTNDTVASDLLVTARTASTPQADISPFEVRFRCFSGELAQVMAKFANSPNGLIVKSIIIEPVTSTGAAFDPNNPTGFVEPPPTILPPTIAEPPMIKGGRGGRFAGPPPPGNPIPRPAYTDKREKDFLNEKPFRVTMMIAVVKPKPSK